VDSCAPEDWPEHASEHLSIAFPIMKDLSGDDGASIMTVIVLPLIDGEV